MAIDTEDKRRSIIGVGAPYRIVLPTANANINHCDRAHTVGSYSMEVLCQDTESYATSENNYTEGSVVLFIGLTKITHGGTDFTTISSVPTNRFNKYKYYGHHT